MSCRMDICADSVASSVMPFRMTRFVHILAMLGSACDFFADCPNNGLDGALPSRETSCGITDVASKLLCGCPELRSGACSCASMSFPTMVKTIIKASLVDISRLSPIAPICDCSRNSCTSVRQTPSRTGRPPAENGPPARGAINSPPTLTNRPTKYLTALGNVEQTDTSTVPLRALVMRLDMDALLPPSAPPAPLLLDGPDPSASTPRRPPDSTLTCLQYSIAVHMHRAKASAQPAETSGLSSSKFLNEMVITSSKLVVGDASPLPSMPGLFPIPMPMPPPLDPDEAADRISIGASSPANVAVARRTSGNLSIVPCLSSLTTSTIALSSIALLMTSRDVPSNGLSFNDDCRHAMATAHAVRTEEIR
mmetsp:Transcript_8614/g.24769  ORF Transcript_8614/g.24769 Transcript_8614/m.24769 type:complete len:366 (+) Transcript_8614:6331-7428(+)